MKITKTGKSQNHSSTKRKPKFWAIIVGVNQYRDPKITNLSFCANDAVGLATALQQVTMQHLVEREAIFEDATILVHGDEASKSRTNVSPSLSIKNPERENILASLDIFAKARSEDTILFYFSGHGDYDENTLNTILCVPETEKNNLSPTGLLIKTVLAKITASAAKQQLIWLDACHSGGMGGQLIDAILQVTKDNPKIYAITSCDRKERSLELPELKHGLFTYHLIQGLQGKLTSSTIKLDELYHYVYYQTLEHIDRANQLAKLIHSHGKYQPFSPQRFAIGSGEFILGLSLPSSADRISRGALILDGIKPSEFALNLSSILASKGGFSYQPYPHAQESVKDSISALLSSANTFTALLYLKGRFVTTDDVSFFVFDDGQEISKDWLAQQVADSTVEQQIIIFDCNNTPQIQRQIELFKQPSKAQCIVAASMENNWLGQEFLEIIKHSSAKGLTGTNLIDRFSRAFYARGIFSLEQRVFYRSDKGIINVILPQIQHLENIVIDRNYCPYKGLEAFTTRDRDFFFGRESLIQEIIARLETDSFVPVVGASGSGKSSIVQAGVIPQLLEEGLFTPQNNRLETCLVWNLRPGEKPLQALADTLSDRQNDSNTIEGILHLGVESFVAWLRQQPQPMGVLVIDQFEELFTQASEVNRSRFLELILGGVKYAGDRFKVIVTLRNDFMASCLAIPELAEIVKQNPLFVPSYLTEEQYRQIITSPATRVGLAVQPELVDVLVSEVSTEKGALPLLEFTLERLWQNRDSGKLSLRVYQEKIGGIKKVLKERADSIYQQLTIAQQECAQWIFTQLVSLGEGQEDTRRRRYLSELIVPKYSQELITSTLNILRNSRLIVMSDRDGDAITSQREGKTKGINHKSKPLELSSDSEVTIEIAHEILIRNWQQLRWWLDENREQIRLRERIEAKATEWQVSGQKTDYLIRGAALSQAEEFYLKYADELPAKSQEFIYQSIEERDRQAKLAKRRRRQLISGLTGGIITLSMLAGAALWQLRRATINEINALNNSAESLLESQQELDALVAALKAGSKIKASVLGVDQKTKYRLIGTLQNIFPKVRESNRIESPSRQTMGLNFSQNGQYLVAPGKDRTTIWNAKGQIVNMYKIAAFSKDEQIVAGEIKKGVIELRDLNNKFVRTLKGHESKIIKLEFSPDNRILVSMDEKRNIKLWNLQGQLIKNIKTRSESFSWLISPNSKIISTTDDKGNIELINIHKKASKTIRGHGEELVGLVFAPNSKIFSAEHEDGVVKIWNINGDLLSKFSKELNSTYFYSGHMQFSPNSQTLLKFDTTSNIVYIWNKDNAIIHKIKDVYSDNLSIKFSSESQTFMLFEYNRFLALWNNNGELIQGYAVKDRLSKEIYPRFDQVYDLDFDYRSKLITIYKDRGTEIEVRDLSNRLIFASSKVTSKVNFSQNGELFSVIESKTKQENTDTVSGYYDSQSDISNISLSSDSNRKVSLYKSDSELLHTFLERMNDVQAITFSPNNKTIISFHRPYSEEYESVYKDGRESLNEYKADYRMKLWKINGELINDNLGKVNTVDFNNLSFNTFSSDDNYYASYNSHNKTITVWDLNNNSLPKILYTHRDDTEYLAFSSDSKTLISISRNGTINFWNIKDQIVALYNVNSRLSKTNFDIKNVFFSSKNNDFALIIDKNLIHHLNSEGKLVSTLRSSDKDLFAGRLRNWYKLDENKFIRKAGGNIYICSKNMLKSTKKNLLFECKDFEEQNDNSIWLWYLTSSPDKRVFAAYVPDTNTIKVWNTEGRLLTEVTYFKSVNSDKNPLEDIYFNSTEEIYTINNGDGKLRFWNYQGEIVDILESRKTGYQQDMESNVPFSFGFFNDVKFSKNSDFFTIKRKRNGELESLVDKTGELLYSLECLPDHTCRITFDSLSNPIILASKKNNEVKAFTLNWKLLFTLDGSEELIGTIFFSPDGKTIITMNDTSIKLWNKQGLLLHSFKKDIKYFDLVNNRISSEYLAISPDGQYIAVPGKYKTVNILNINGEILVLKGHMDEVHDVKFDENSNIIASASRDGTVKLWNMKGELLSTFHGDGQLLDTVDISPDGKIIIASRTYQYLELWSLDLDRLLSKGCDWTRDYLTNNPNISQEDKIICDGIK